MNNFLYGMWFIWFCLCVYAHEGLNTYSFVIGAFIIPGLLVMVTRGIWFLLRLVKFKWERRNG